MRTWSLRRKLQFLTATVVAVALLLFGTATTFNFYNEQIEALDEGLVREGEPLLDRIANSSSPDLWLESPEGTEIVSMLRARSVVVRDPRGQVLYETGDLSKQALPRPGGDRRFRTVRIGDANTRLGVFEKRGYQLAIAFDLDEVADIVGDLMLAYLFALPLAVLSAAFGAWWITEKALAPIVAIAETAEGITARRLDRRLPEPMANDEIGRLTRILNRMLDRLERAFRSANRFSADASHELNTPLTIIRGRIEEMLDGRRTAPATDAFLADLLEETNRLSGITQHLLLLAKADASQLELHCREVDLSELVEGTLEDAEILAAHKKIELERRLQPRIVLRIDAGRLRQVLLNLFDNAVKYSPPRGRVRVTLERTARGCVCSVANSGPAIPADKANQIFERFFRLDPARGDANRGHGLGLSICRELIDAHGGRLELAENRPGHVEFRFHLPAQTA